jgi:hypothetical protein
MLCHPPAGASQHWQPVPCLPTAQHVLHCAHGSVLCSNFWQYHPLTAVAKRRKGATFQEISAIKTSSVLCRQMVSIVLGPQHSCRRSTFHLLGVHGATVETVLVHAVAAGKLPHFLGAQRCCSQCATGNVLQLE